jgi:hypothetical protein
MTNERLEGAGFQFDKENVGRILAEIERRKKSKKDYVGDTRKVSVQEADGELVLRVVGDAVGYHGFTPNGQSQLADTLGIPRQFFGRLAADKRHRGQLGQLSTHLLHEELSTRLIRTLDGKVRAVLSSAYRTLDNADLFFLAADEFQKAGAEIWDARLSDDTFRLYAVAPGITAEVHDDARPNANWSPGSHWSSDEGGNADRHVAAVSISNSETGGGALKVRPATLRIVCANWNVWDQSLSQIHLGKKQEEQGWISDDTKRLEDRVIWGKVRDVIRTAFDPKRFEEVIAKLRGAKAEEVVDPVKAVEAVVEFTALPESSLDAIRAKFVKEKDFTRYGLVQAVTWQAHEAKDDEDKNLFDDAGAKVLATPLAQIVK